jgi:AcrR family transcriptional regulator/DNA-binding MarR family transcriptional regulator
VAAGAGTGADAGGAAAGRGALADAAREEVSGIQRSRLLAAAVEELDARGYAGTTVAHITGRSRISRRTFYELFANREECLIAILGDAVAAVEQELATAGLAGLPWRERVRGGLWGILCFCDREPALARVCLVQALGAGGAALELRESALARLAAIVDEGRGQSAQGTDCTALTAEGVVGSVLAIVHARLLRRDSQPLRGLVGELTAMVVLPYLGRAAARREQLRPIPAIPEPQQAASLGSASRPTGDPLVGVPMRLTYRTARVLQGAREHPGASNRELADHAGIGDPGQVSKLLARLRRLGLIEHQAQRVKGEPNAWTLTPKGLQVTQSIDTHTTTQRRAA